MQTCCRSLRRSPDASSTPVPTSRANSCPPGRRVRPTTRTSDRAIDSGFGQLRARLLYFVGSITDERLMPGAQHVGNSAAASSHRARALIVGDADKKLHLIAPDAAIVDLAVLNQWSGRQL